MSEVSGGVAIKSRDGLLNPLGNTPVALETRISPGRVIPFTLGHLASQLVEMGIVRPTVDAACDYFGVTHEEFGDIRVYAAPDEVEGFIQEQVLIESDAVWTELEPGYELHMAHIIAELKPYRIPEAEQESMEAEIDRLVVLAEEHFDETSHDSKRELPLLRMKRSAVRTGIAVPMNAMLGAALSYPGDSPLSAESVIDAAGDIVFEVERLDPENLLLSEVTLGQWELDSFMEGLRRAFKLHCYKQGRAKAEVLEDIIYTH